MEMDKRSDLYEDWKKRVFLGPLPHSFLRIEDTLQQQQEAADQQTALALQQLQMQNMPPMHDTRVGKLSITVSQAKLVKNYGLVTKMDPYVRVRVGHEIYETHTASNGGKNPHWNQIIQCFLPLGVTQIYVEIYDECSFTMDELIAYGHITIPPQVLLKGETHEDWYLLSGKQGDNQEGMINIVFSYTTKCHPQMGPLPVTLRTTRKMGMNSYIPINAYVAPAPTVPPSSLPNAEVELKQIGEMFPSMDEEVIKSVYNANHGKKDATINSLLQMCE